MKEKNRILFHRLFWLILLVISIVSIVLLFFISKSKDDTSPFILLSLFVPLFIFSFAFFIASLFLVYKEYDYNGIKISVYFGWYHHNLRVNGELCDEYNSLTSLTPICLSTTLNDGTKLETKGKSLKINGKLIK